MVNMRYNVAQLLKGPTGARRQYDLNHDIRNLDEDLEPLDPLEGSIELMRTSQGIMVTGTLRTVLRMECQRCLTLTDTETVLDLEEEFHPIIHIGDIPLDAVPDEDDEALLIDEQHILDLTEVIRQGLWLAAPMGLLCRPDCAGLCPQCGGNRNLGECQCEQHPYDSRWAALRALLPEASDQQERSD